MEIFPAIDIKGGKAVRLFKGDFSKVTEYSDDPLSVAQGFKKLGAKNLHLVDLDGAKDGSLVNFDTVSEIVDTSGMFCEIGGGIRDLARAEKYLTAGVGRIIIGTAAIEDEGFLKEAIAAFKEKLAVGVDANRGKVAVRGWLSVTETDAFAFCEKLGALGVKTVIYTDIEKDGTLSGTNIDAYRRLVRLDGLNIVASGGITYAAELVSLKELGVAGAILGKALYDGRLKLDEALRVAVC